MTKRHLQIALTFVLVFLAGVVTMRIWDSYRFARANREDPQVHVPGSDSLLIVNMEDGSEPEGVVEVRVPEYIDDSTLPSQLSKIRVQGLKQVISRSGQKVNAPEAEDNAPVALGDANRNAVPSGTAPQEAPLPKDSNISMINAPVQARLIKSLAEYKAFKRVALGKYPEANFAKDYILVLESTSNLPDKVFEIQDVLEQDGKMLVVYRVNILGLDKKINSHSAVRIDKRDLPIELKQVL